MFLLAMAAAAQDRTISAGADVRWLSFSKDGQTLYGICGDNQVRHWNVKTGALSNANAWTADERFAGGSLASGLLALGGKSSVALTDVATGATVRRIPIGERRATQVAIAPDGMAIAGGARVTGNSRDETMRMWDAAGKQKFEVASGIGGTSAIAISPDGSLLAAGSWDTNLRVWSTSNGELVKLIDDLPVAMFGVVFSPDGKNLAAAGVDRTVYIWDIRTWKLARKLTGQEEMISAIAFSADSSTLATGGFNDITSKHPVSILVWDFASGKVRKTMPAPHRVGSVALSPDGKLVAAAAGDTTVRLWNVQ